MGNMKREINFRNNGEGCHGQPGEGEGETPNIAKKGEGVGKKPSLFCKGNPAKIGKSLRWKKGRKKSARGGKCQSAFGFKEPELKE